VTQEQYIQPQRRRVLSARAICSRACSSAGTDWSPRAAASVVPGLSVWVATPDVVNRCDRIQVQISRRAHGCARTRAPQAVRPPRNRVLLSEPGTLCADSAMRCLSAYRPSTRAEPATEAWPWRVIVEPVRRGSALEGPRIAVVVNGGCGRATVHITFHRMGSGPSGRNSSSIAADMKHFVRAHLPLAVRPSRSPVL
jgi:hypothetical protein